MTWSLLALGLAILIRWWGPPPIRQTPTEVIEPQWLAKNSTRRLMETVLNTHKAREAKMVPIRPGLAIDRRARKSA